MHKPDVIILDEPTSGLDPLVQSRFFEILKDEHAQGTTVLLSSHTLSEVQNHCRRVAIIRDGRIVETSDVADLRRRRYRKVRIVADEQLIDEVLETDGVVLDSRGENRAVFLYEGVIAGLLARLSPSRIHDLLIEEPSLEEVFLHYYREDGEG
jgi:ABC-2 type transport system ATP-binding protein